MVVNLLLDARRKLARFGGVERQAKLKKHILQAHDAQAHRPPLRVRARRLRDRIIVDVDDPVQHRHGEPDCVGQLFKIKPSARDMPRQVDRTQVAHGGLVV